MNNHGVGGAGVSHCSLTRVLHVLLSVHVCRQTSQCVLKSVSLVRNLCEHTFPWRGFGSKTACCFLEFRGLSRSQRGSSFAERVGRTPERVSRGCRRKAEEEGGKWEGGGVRGERKKETTIIIRGINLASKLFQDTNVMEPTVTCPSPSPPKLACKTM